MPAQKLLMREVYDGHGGICIHGKDDKEVSTAHIDVQPAEAPNLVPDVGELVVLPLPLRSKSHVWEKHGLYPNWGLTDYGNAWSRCLDREAATELLATALAEHDTQTAREIFNTCFMPHGDQRIGLYVILAACGVDVSAEPAFQYHVTGETTPLARYLMIVTDNSDGWLQRQFPFNATTAATTPDAWPRTMLLRVTGPMSTSENMVLRLTYRSFEMATPAGDFLHQLAKLRDLKTRWSAPANLLTPLCRKTDLRESLAYVIAHRHTAAGRSLLVAMQAHDAHSPAHWRAIADTWGVLGQDGDYRARYEQAWCLNRAGDRTAARAKFLTLYEEALTSGFLPPLDDRFRRTLEEEDPTKDAWAPLMRGTAARLVKDNNRLGALALARQVSDLNDPLLANNLLDITMTGEMKKEETIIVDFAAIEYLETTGQMARAEGLLRGLQEIYPNAPALWRMAANLADKREQRAEAIACLEKALDLEYAHLPEVIGLQQWRKDYGRLLTYYLDQARALHDAGKPASDDLAVRTVRAVDRWRAHDPEIGLSLHTAAAALAILGKRDLAWDYYTTFYATSTESSGLTAVARSLANEESRDLAERAFAAVCAAEPADGQLAWDRAQNLRQAGRVAEADALLRKLADDKAVSASLRDRVRWQLGERGGR
jgi:tetratricopeptide (TPR) repeat protein